MKYILATDSFKGSLSSMEVEAEIAEVLTEKGADVVSMPMSDGGDGMLEAFTKALGGTIEPVYVHNQMMRRVDAAFGMTADGTAIVEVAQACGLELVKEDERNPMRATTYGVGELLSRAVKRGCRNFIIGLGGSGTSDAGIGMLRALVDIFAKGKTFDDAMKTELGECRFTLACDVDNPLCGENGAAYVYAPQKGATPQMVEQLDRRAKLFAEKSALHYGYDRSCCPGAGAAGGDHPGNRKIKQTALQFWLQCRFSFLWIDSVYLSGCFCRIITPHPRRQSPAFCNPKIPGSG